MAQKSPVHELRVALAVRYYAPEQLHLLRCSDE